MDFNRLKELVNFCNDAEIKYLIFNGGEPLLYSSLIDILKYIKEKKYNFQIAIPTNGIVLKDVSICESIVRNGVNYIDISLKGKDKNEFREITKYDYFSHQEMAIQNLSRLPIDFTCSMVLTHDNIMTFCDTIQHAKMCGGKQFSFTFEIDNDLSTEKDVAYLTQHNPFGLIDKFFLQLSKLNSITNDWWIEYSFPLCFYSDAQLKLLEKKMATACNVHHENGICFDTKLNLLLCDMFIDQKLGTFGQDFSSYKEFVKFCNGFDFKNKVALLKEIPSKHCLVCKYLSKCYGGCPIIWKNYSFGAAQNIASPDKIISRLKSTGTSPRRPEA